MSLPSAARLPDDTDPTDPSEPKTLVCPRCRAKWSEKNAPSVCPIDGLSLVRPHELPDSKGASKSARTGAAGAATDASIAYDDDDPMVGRTLEGRYTILARLGAGSMGTVYRAKQHAMGREVAIKILRGDRAVDDSAKARFMREARANSLLASPNTVTVFDFGQSESGEFYLAMELLDGESLGQRLQREGRLPTPLAVDAARQALRSLGEAHAKGIIHRDLKPDNLFFARVLTGSATRAEIRRADGTSTRPPASPHEEIVKVLDFGIAKLIDAEPTPMGVIETQAGTVFGTPRYMSPEQAQGKPLDARSDLYSLGVILYQMLAGRPPFTDNDAVVVMARHIKSTPKPLSEVCPEAAVPKALEDVVMRTLAKEPAGRPPSAEILAGELLAALEAEGAASSGVRASITNAAGIRVPESMRPPPIPLPKAKRRSLPLAFMLGIPVFVVVAVAIGAFLGLSHRPSVQSVVANTSARPTRPARTASEPSTSTAGANVGAVDLGDFGDDTTIATITPDALPKAADTTLKATAGRPASPGAPIKGVRPLPSGKASAAPPTAAPSTTSAYGIFD